MCQGRQPPRAQTFGPRCRRPPLKRVPEGASSIRIGKWQIEEHIRGLGVPATILRPAGFMEDFISPARFFQRGSLNVPWRDDLVMQLIAIDDIGAFAALAFAKPDEYLGRAMEITGDKLTAPQIAAALSTAAGRPVPHTQIPLKVLWDHSPAAAKVLFTWANQTYSAPTSRHCGRRSQASWTSVPGWNGPAGRGSWRNWNPGRRDRHGHLRHRQAHQPASEIA